MRSPYHQPSYPDPMGATFPLARLAEAWVPYQCHGLTFDHTLGLHAGTIYPELVRPYQPHPNVPDELVHLGRLT